MPIAVWVRQFPHSIIGGVTIENCPATKFASRDLHERVSDEPLYSFLHRISYDAITILNPLTD